MDPEHKVTANVSEFIEFRFITDVADDDEPPQIKSFCIILPAAKTRERLFHHPDARGLLPFVEDFEVLLARTLRKEMLARQAAALEKAESRG